MRSPPPYPRIPHLVDKRGTDDDQALGLPEREELLGGEVTIEEKLDGANAMCWVDDGVVCASGRSGPEALDRAKQFGALRGWALEHSDQLRELLTPRDAVLYGEWLFLTHTVHYGRLPDWFVGFDLWSAGEGFVPAEPCRELLTACGIAAPPRLGTGRYSVAQIDAMNETSIWADQPAEGMIVRPWRGSTIRVAKLVREGFQPRTDDDWKGARVQNELATSRSPLRT